jgi:hypothetical protein
MTGECLNAILAERVMGWNVAPDRFLTGGRRWIARWRFQPLTRLEDAFELLEKAGATFTLTTAPGGGFTFWTRVNGRDGSASAASIAVAISVAIARAIGLEISDEQLAPLFQGLSGTPNGGARKR